MVKKDIAFVHLFGILVGSIFSLFFLKILIDQHGVFSYFFLFPAICGSGLIGYILGIFLLDTIKKRINKKDVF